jgi:hypothetical protein
VPAAESPTLFRSVLGNANALTNCLRHYGSMMIPGEDPPVAS